jgi:hypothetical protein
MENKKIIILSASIAVLLFIVLSLTYAFFSMKKKYNSVIKVLEFWEKGIEANSGTSTTEASELSEADAIAVEKDPLPPEPVLMLGGNLSYRIGYDRVKIGYIVEPTKSDIGRFVFYFRQNLQRYEFYKADFDPELHDEGELNPVQILTVQLIPGTDPTALVKSAIASIIKNNDKN